VPRRSALNAAMQVSPEAVGSYSRCLMIKTPPSIKGWPPAIQFRGWVACRRDGEGPLGLVLIGATVDQPREVAHLAFSAVAPADMPEALEDARVERIDERAYRVVSGPSEWIIEGVAHLHREVGKAFYEAIPPRGVPWRKKLFWWLALRAAANLRLQRWLFRQR
jgi:hypothetical protein